MSSQTQTKMTTMKWLLKREFWEHKGGFFWTPLVISIVVVLVTAVTVALGVTHTGSQIITINGQVVTSLAEQFSGEQKASAIAQFAEGYMGTSVPLLFVLVFTLFFYCLSALFDERKDRSVLFWKSLPVTDSATVVSKVLVALVLVPLITLGVAVALALVEVVLIAIGAAALGINIFGGVLSSPALYLAPIKLAAIIPIYALWALPTVGWLMMVGAWAKTKPFLLAVGLPLLVGGLIAWFNKILSLGWNTDWLWKYIIGRGLLSISPGSWFAYRAEDMRAISNMEQLDMSSLLAQSWAQISLPNIWIGAAAGAARIYAAIRLRRWRDEG